MTFRTRIGAPQWPRSRAGMVLLTLTAVPVWMTSPLVRRWHMQWGKRTPDTPGATPNRPPPPRRRPTRRLLASQTLTDAGS